MPSMETSSTSSSSATRLSSGGPAASAVGCSSGVVALAVFSLMPASGTVIRPALAGPPAPPLSSASPIWHLGPTLKALSAKGQDRTSGLSHARLARGMLLSGPRARRDGKAVLAGERYGDTCPAR